MCYSDKYYYDIKKIVLKYYFVPPVFSNCWGPGPPVVRRFLFSVLWNPEIQSLATFIHRTVL